VLPELPLLDEELRERIAVLRARPGVAVDEGLPLLAKLCCRRLHGNRSMLMACLNSRSLKWLEPGTAQHAAGRGNPPSAAGNDCPAREELAEI